MNRLQAITLRFHNFTDPKFSTPPPARRKSISKLCLAVGALAFGLFAGALNSQAQLSNVWIAGSGNWSDNSSWSAGTPPAPTDDAYFTNAATYTVHITAITGITSNFFSNGSGTVATVTLDIQPNNELDQAGNFVVGSEANATNTVYVASNNTGPTSNAGLNAGTMTVGRNGVGYLIITNGILNNAGRTIGMGSGNGGQGHIVVSGPGTQLLCSQFQLGTGSNSLGGCTMDITNGGTVIATSTPRVGGGGSQVTSNNVLTVHAGSLLVHEAGPFVIGARTSAAPIGGAVSINNVVDIKSGGVWQCGTVSKLSSVDIGDANFFGQGSTVPNTATNNSLTIEYGGSVTQASVINISPTNALNILGGYLDCTIITNWGTINAWGSSRGGIVANSNSTVRVLTALGRYSVTNSLILNTNATLEMALGTSFPAGPLGGIDCGSVVISNVASVFVTAVTNGTTALYGTLNFTDSGGFAPGTYTILTYVPSPASGTPTNFFWAGTIGTVPNNTYTYAIDTNTIGKVNLVVMGPAVVTPFRIISVTKSGNDIALKWTAPSGVTNRVQANPGIPLAGSYNTSGFADITADIITAASGTNNFTDTGGATNKPARYYRIRQPG